MSNADHVGLTTPRRVARQRLQDFALNDHHMRRLLEFVRDTPECDALDLTGTPINGIRLTQYATNALADLAMRDANTIYLSPTWWTYTRMVQQRALHIHDALRERLAQLPNE